MFNLVLAVIWGLGGVVLIVYHALTDDPRGRIKLIGGDLSLGWAALVISLYNVARYFAFRAGQAEKRATAEYEERIRRRHEHPREPYGEPDPNFRFTDEPPPTKRDDITGPPPTS